MRRTTSFISTGNASWVRMTNWSRTRGDGNTLYLNKKKNTSIPAGVQPMIEGVMKTAVGSRPVCKSSDCLIRYADDFVCAFEKEEDAQRFYEALGERLKKFNLELSAEKTHIIPFSPTGQMDSTSFNLLGFEFRWGQDRAGKPHVDKRTARKSLRNSLTAQEL